ncbi:MAG: hypothetical protein OHK0056_28510 [Bacteriovoracaceae bacterium]
MPRFANLVLGKKRNIEVVKHESKHIVHLDYCSGHEIYKIVSLDCIEKNECQMVNLYKFIKTPLAKIEIGSFLHHRCYINLKEAKYW